MMMNEERREEALEMSESGAAGSYDNPDDFRTLGLQLLCRDDGVPDTSATEGASPVSSCQSSTCRNQAIFSS